MRPAWGRLGPASPQRGCLFQPLLTVASGGCRVPLRLPSRGWAQLWTEAHGSLSPPGRTRLLGRCLPPGVGSHLAQTPGKCPALPEAFCGARTLLSAQVHQCSGLGEHKPAPPARHWPHTAFCGAAYEHGLPRAYRPVSAGPACTHCLLDLRGAPGCVPSHRAQTHGSQLPPPGRLLCPCPPWPLCPSPGRWGPRGPPHRRSPLRRLCPLDPTPGQPPKHLLGQPALHPPPCPFPPHTAPSCRGLLVRLLVGFTELLGRARPGRRAQPRRQGRPPPATPSAAVPRFTRSHPCLRPWHHSPCPTPPPAKSPFCHRPPSPTCPLIFLEPSRSPSLHSMC